jgi:hypothetical protein
VVAAEVVAPELPPVAEVVVLAGVVVVVVVVVGVVVVRVDVVVVEPPVPAQVLERLKEGSPPSLPAPEPVPPLIVAEASRRMAPLGSSITAPLPPGWMKPDVLVTVTSAPFTSKYTVRLLKPVPELAGTMKWKPSVVVPFASKSQLDPKDDAVTFSCASLRQAPLGGEVVQSGALAVAETLVTARTPHTETLTPATARLAPRFRRTRHSVAGRRNCLTLDIASG